MYLEQLQVALKNKFDTEVRSGTHVSDIIMCIRKNALRRIEPVPTTMKELNFFTSGRAIGDAIQQLSKYSAGKFIIEHEVEMDGIVAHIDLYDSEHNIPIECKSMRVKEIKPDGDGVVRPKPHHLEQIKNYMTMVDSDTGYLLYQFLMHFDETPFAEFEVHMTKEERELQKLRMKSNQIIFERAVASKDGMIADPVIEDKTLNWLCNSCPYVDRCRQERDSKK